MYSLLLLKYSCGILSLSLFLFLFLVLSVAAGCNPLGKALDADNSGTLSYWEFSQGLKKLGCKLDKKQVEQLLKDLDEVVQRV